MRCSATTLLISLRTVIGGVDAFAFRSTTTATRHVLRRSLFFPPATLQSALVHRQNSPQLAMASSSSSSSSSRKAEPESKPAKRYPPSRVVIDSATSEKWRLCVAAAVLRPADGALLVGERFGAPGSWQCPQGGVDDVDPESSEEQPARRERAETLREGAARELDEEMGLLLGQHVEYLYGGNDIADEANVSPKPLRYTTKGTGSWLEKQGFAGQELHWVFFKCISDECNNDPRSVCDLSGRNGERQEFTDVRWETVDKVAEDVWEKKRGPYVALAEFLRKKEKVGS